MVVAVAQLGEESLVVDVGLVAPLFATGDLLLASEETDMDPYVALEPDVGSHERLDRDIVHTLVVGVVMAEGVVDMADDGCVT